MKSTTILSLATLLLCAVASAAEPVFVCEPAENWTALFDRTDGWIAGDGIYSFGMEGVSTQGSANAQSKTIFTFSDSLFGGVNPDGSYKEGLVMTNHAVAILSSNKPDSAKMRFFHNTNTDGRPSNLFDRNYWINGECSIELAIYPALISCSD